MWLQGFSEWFPGVFFLSTIISLSYMYVELPLVCISIWTSLINMLICSQIVSVSCSVVVPVVFDWVSVPHKGAGLLSTSLLLSVSFSISCFLSGCGCRWSSVVIFVLLSLLVDKCNPLIAFRLQEENKIRTPCVRYHDEDEKADCI